MKKMYYLILGRDAAFIRNLFVASLLLISFQAFGQGNGSMACNDLVQVSLDEDCQAQIEPDMILEGTYNDPYSLFTVKISGVIGDVVVQPGYHTVTVTNTQTNNNCWGDILVEDKLPPIIENCPCAEANDDPECQFYCSDLEGILDGSINVPTPDVKENCGIYYTNTSDLVTDNGCNGKIIERTYRYTDEYGNQSLTCKAYYYLAPLDISDVTPPTTHVHLPCDSGVSMEEIYNYFLPLVGAKQALINAYPTVNGSRINNQGMCNLVASKTDVKTLVCGDDCPKSFKMLRTWSVIDWCSNESREYVQIISTKDLEKPTIQAEDFTKSVNPWNCEADFTLPAPTILHDNCDDNVTYSVQGPLGATIVYDPITKTWSARKVEKGIHNFYYKALDCCGNEGIDTVIVTVVDKSSPVAISKEFVVVSLTKEHGHNGIAKIYPQSIDNGSHDGCTDVHLEIRREGNLCGHVGNNTYNNDGHPDDKANDPDDGNYVKFCCEDLTDVSPEGVPFGRVKVWLRVWDDGDMDGIYGSAGDNYNETWSWVRVEDKLPPTIICPDDITIECHEDYNNLDVTGRATASFTCNLGMVEYDDVNSNLNSCGFGTVTRRWYIKNNPNVFCYQYITINDGTYFNPNSINWPRDETTTCDNIHDYEVTWTDAQCALLGVSVKSDTFQFVDGVCLKIINKYTVVDWCVYEPNNPNTAGMWMHTQVVKVRDDVAPMISCRDTMVVASDPSDSDNDGVTCEHRNLMLTNSATDEGDCSSKWLRWQVFVDLWGDGVSEYEFTSFVPANDNSFNDTNGNGIPDIYLGATNSNEEVKITIPEDIAGSMSTHKVTWKVTDGCGNHRSCTTNLMVVDKKKPTPYCISLSSAVMENGTVELWARDFDKGSFDNCTAQEDLLFTFENARPVASKINIEHFFKGDGLNATQAEYDSGDAQKWVPSFNSSAMIFNCDDLPSVDLKMTVWDEKGEFDFCVVTLTLVDNQGGCSGGTRVGISGQITDVNGEGMDQVEVALHNDQLVNYPIQTLTNSEGIYEFANHPSNVDYSISVVKDNDYMNGVSTLDLVLIQRHILGISELDSPYKIIAADVNSDEQIRTSDLVELRKLILGINSSFENNTSWKFLDKTQSFADPSHPWPLVEVLDFANITADQNNVNFFGQKIGDVNGSAKANFRSTSSENRSGKTLNVWMDAQDVKANEEFEMEVTSPNDASIYGLQFTLDAYDLQFVNIGSSLFEIDETNFNQVQNGKVNVSLSSSSLVEVKAGQSLFTLTYKPIKSGNVSDMIDFNSSNIQAETYFEDFTVGKIQLAFRDKMVNEEFGFNVSQNEPNPFSEKTSIAFTLPSKGQVSIEVFDVKGKQIHRFTGDFEKGENRYEMHKDQFPLSGVYYCKVENNQFSSVVKMIYLK